VFYRNITYLRGINEGERKFRQINYKFDRDLNGNNIWTDGEKSFSSVEFVEDSISFFLKILSQRKKNRSSHRLSTIGARRNSVFQDKSAQIPASALPNPARQ